MMFGKTNCTVVNKDEQKVICLLLVNDKKWVWHRRLGHANWRLISKLSKLQLVKGLPNIDYHSYALCGAC